MWFRKFNKNKHKSAEIFMDHAAGRDNPSAIYEEGRLAKMRLEEARTNVARTLHVQARDIIFTSGGTEADNLAILGVFEAAREHISNPHIIVSNVEHPAILEAAREVERRGAEVTYLETMEGGAVDAHTIENSLRSNTAIVSIMYVNNETGARNPIARIARILRAERTKRGNVYPLLHTDASQAALTETLDVSQLGVDLLTLDASKVGAPKGLGLLMVRPNVPIKPILFGGGQERGLRPGTEHVEAIVEFAGRLDTAQSKREGSKERFAILQKLFVDEVRVLVPQAIINTPHDSAPHIVSVSIPNALHEFLAIKLAERGVYVSTGSSCSTRKRVDEKEALRFSFSADTSEKDIRKAVRILSEVV
jgi:cysteine desulfurase